VWCHLGGRIGIGETIEVALQRHASDALVGQVTFNEPNDRPQGLVEWFRHPDVADDSPKYGVDPRKHAVSCCYAAESTGPLDCKEHGEGAEFDWFTPDDIARCNDTWDGTKIVVDRIVRGSEQDISNLQQNLRSAYGVLATRVANHNTLVWQTPALALTAEAFLLTVALNPVYSHSARLVAAGLNLMLSLLCLQLMSKHKEMVKADRNEMVLLEHRLGLASYHAKTDTSTFKLLAKPWSSTLWMSGFVVLAAVAAGIFASVLGFDWAIITQFLGLG
jgi:hypothetical protein